MAYTTADARQQLLDGLAEAIDEIASALASLGEAYEQLDEQKADKLEQELFRPVQMAYGRAKRSHADFASRHGLPARSSSQPPLGPLLRASRASLHPRWRPSARPTVHWR